MKRSRLTLWTPLLAGLMLLAGCNKKEGCTDGDATNYDSEVKEKNDDGSCMYEGQYTLWFDQGFADYYGDKFPISVYEGDDLLGTAEATDAVANAPDCGSKDHVTFTMDLGTKKSEDYVLDVKDASGNDFYIYTITVEAGECGVGRL